ncbi:gas vesicle protein K [Streptomyces physcomitrii]|uniref:Gas vesicle protein K n=1 Tax=Streptomyces physcomitrii TaxID=2724184 RepID=A0ABX1H0S0_9ACTN|nr:gas vesicle protein K [Streptomyces physcomitrii]NKI41952.1 gas vesicle protein K [Streptomyces physcomitrii]
MTQLRATDPDHREGEDPLTTLARSAAQAFDLLPAEPGTGRAPAGARRLAADPETVERDLLKLVLTLVELLRQLMERTALHRVDKEDLTSEQEERIGLTLMLLHDRMGELCAEHGLEMEDLNLDLGPLGSLLPR